MTGIYELILKDGLRQTRFKNSKLKSLSSAEEGAKGAIFGYRSKEAMIAAKGLVLTSLEAVESHQKAFTHWTPNVYRYGTYSDKNRQITKGHSEDNLRQINTFTIDFDEIEKADAMTSSDILTAAIDLGFMPTAILKSDHGFQAYFVLSQPAYVTASSEFKVIKVAKTISQNLRLYFQKEGLPVDMTCNHFGIARMPREDNLEFYHPDYCYSFEEWINWSMKQSDWPVKRPNLSVISGTQGKKQIDEPWYQKLMNESVIKGAKAQMGRNNVLFTLALANYSSGVSQGDCEVVLDQFNDRLVEPLASEEVLKIVKSAYSEKYEAASRDYILLLCKTWVNENLTTKDLFIRQGWTKFKKKRSQRTRSHFYEWKEDILAYLREETSSDSPTLQTSKKAIREALKIPERSLDKVLQLLKEDQKVFYKVKAGRGGGIWIGAVRTLLLQTLQLRKEKQEAYMSYLAELFRETKERIARTMVEALESLEQAKQLYLFEADVG
ncbi:primase C-terminal domain-containing protein [Streptococcus sobrinus]|uniref:primase C-terminal domain-containing protein n=1 Tax=Streptococcus sobrinus TaxID=1310 RepID=UPI000303E50D|nr:primase C-terminal domain-containing protein [Streptococcus sobrinus]